MILERPKIAIVLPALGAGGSELVVNFLANRWVAAGHAVTILSLDHAEHPSYYRYDNNVVIEQLGLPPRKRAMPVAAWLVLRRIAALRRRLRAIRPDVVISFLSRTNVMTLLAARGLGLPVIVSERNNPKRQPIGPIWSRLRASLYPNAFGLVTMTAGARDFFPPYQRPKTWVIPNFVASGIRGAKPNGVTPGVSLNGNDETPVRGRTIVAVGRLVDQKGFDLLIEAFGRIAERSPGWSLRIWGEGEARQALEELRGLRGLEGRVAMPGISDSHGGWIHDSDVFVMSSCFEGWGIALLEAMAAGLPVISFDCEWGPGEMITNGVDGLLVAREDVGGLAQALTSLIEDAAMRDRLGRAARLSAHRFDPESAGGSWDAVVSAAVASVPKFAKSYPISAAALTAWNFGSWPIS